MFFFKIKSKEDLKRFDFVALIKVEETAPKNDKLLWINGDIKFTVKELLKGDNRTTINISDFGFPCMQELPQKGEQLLVFGSISDGKMKTHTCSFFRMVDNKLPSYASVESIESLRNIVANK